MEDKLISVIVPIYMVEKYLDKCILSIINQTYKNLEIILVNDGSKDNCLNICKKYASQDKRIKIINQSNSGVSSARNAALDIANGDYIGFVDPDDYIENNMYETLIKLLEENNADIAVGAYKRFTENETINKNPNIQKKVQIFNKEVAMHKLLEDRELTNHLCNKLFKKELFYNIRLPIVKIFEDLGIMYLLFDKINLIVTTDQIIYYYFVRKGSAVNTMNLELLKQGIFICKQREKFLIEKDYNKEYVDLGTLSMYIGLLWHLVRAREKELYYSKYTEELFDKIKNTHFIYANRILKGKKKKIQFCMFKISKRLTYIILGIFKNYTR